MRFKLIMNFVEISKLIVEMSLWCQVVISIYELRRKYNLPVDFNDNDYYASPIDNEYQENEIILINNNGKRILGRLEEPKLKRRTDIYRNIENNDKNINNLEIENTRLNVEYRKSFDFDIYINYKDIKQLIIVIIFNLEMILTKNNFKIDSFFGSEFPFMGKVPTTEKLNEITNKLENLKINFCVLCQRIGHKAEECPDDNDHLN
ncbi:hypothetical protein BCR32DRAFT_285562 [Anaeromyces robustus]|uniref:CCHC-type domain-containing protein n=1 Tax=Anaeromyces robustus TaxID=1754192 RepID=A0A1Y1WJ20_9FUNG|nr:hypothetical protein BCR32DRAFT_285562 [Anaeromyces robustus]|eukprot:ORX73529.1 hypothetical protein BCR32DRAFT_285562 [Anaeromyces robustus]